MSLNIIAYTITNTLGGILMLQILDKKYLKYIFYICLAAIGIFISYNVIFHFGTIWGTVIGLISNIFVLLAPVVIGIVIAYLLYPLTKAIDKFLVKVFKIKHNSHLISVILTYVSVLLFFVLLVYSIYALIGGQFTGNNTISAMVASISGYISKYNELFQYINSKIIESGLSVNIKNYLNQSITQISKYVSLSFSSILEFSMGFGSSVLNTFLGLFISFYLLKDYEFFKNMYNKMMSLFFKEEKLHSISQTGKEINHIISRFIRGQLLDALIVGLLSSIGLSIIGLDFAFLIGFAAGIANIIPYVGPIFGCIPAIIVAVLSPHPINALWAVLVFFIVQQLDGAVISPKVVGDSTGLHPVFIMIAIILGSSFGGILGMLLSVPIMGILKLFATKYIDKKQKTKCVNEISSEK